MEAILLRADGNATIGLGHVYRCLAIAGRLYTEFRFFFAIQEPSEELKDLLNPLVTIVSLPATDDQIQETATLKILIEKISARIVILDGYYFNTAYQRKIKRDHVKLVSIDDDQPYHYISDVVINHADGLDENKISTEPYTKKLIGFKYLLLRQKFIDLDGIERTIPSVTKVIICFGGTDRQNVTRKALDVVLKNKKIGEVHVITGNAYTETDELNNFCRNNARVSCHTNLRDEDLIQLMLKCDLAIVPSSTIALEAFISKMLLVTGITADNQQNILTGLKKYNNVTSIGDFNLISSSELEECINSIVDSRAKYKMSYAFNLSENLLKNIKSLI